MSMFLAAANTTSWYRGQPEKWHINREERDVLLGFAKPEQGYHLLYRLQRLEFLYGEE